MDAREVVMRETPLDIVGYGQSRLIVGVPSNAATLH
jgi:hypothetical protein